MWVLVVKMCRWGEWRRQSVCGSHHSASNTVMFHCSDFTHKNYMNTKIIPANVCTVLEYIIKNLLQLFLSYVCLSYLMSLWISTTDDDIFISYLTWLRWKAISVVTLNIGERQTRLSWILPPATSWYHPDIIHFSSCCAHLNWPSPLCSRWDSADEMLSGLWFKIWVGLYLFKLKGAHGIVMAHYKRKYR